MGTISVKEGRDERDNCVVQKMEKIEPSQRKY